MKYRKKSIIVEAFQYDGDLKGENGKYYIPEWAVQAFDDGIIYYDSLGCNTPPCELFICVLGNNRHVSVGDYIIKGVNGKIYSCEPDKFEKKYELA